VAGWCFTVLGEPAPQGSKKFVGLAGGHGILKESSKKVGPWREAVKAAAPSGPRLDGPLLVAMVFTMKRPSSAKKAETMPYRTPDLSKLCRSTEDGITEAGLWADDARVSEYVRLAKVWPGYDRHALDTPGLIVGAVEADKPVLFEGTYWEPKEYLRHSFGVAALERVGADA
jgi:Holliday junction resolvase RusA-like endonuclease